MAITPTRPPCIASLILAAFVAGAVFGPASHANLAEAGAAPAPMVLGAGSRALAEIGVGFVLEELNLAFVPIPAGEFWMGSVPAMEYHEEDQGPATLVRISNPFWMSAIELTQEAFEVVMDDNPSEYLGEPTLPVENVSWMSAVEFCEQLTVVEKEAARLPQGHVHRLPTEAEWEYAARAGSKTQFPSPIHHYAWYRENSGGRTQPAGILKPNAWGLHDMLGNVFEWNLDWYGPYPGGVVTDPPETPINGSHRVVRGGSWASTPERVHHAKRGGDEPDLEGMVLGFRVVLAPER